MWQLVADFCELWCGFIMSSAVRTVLLAPQHWGLGHVTRSIPVIRYFVAKGWRVLLASSGAGAALLKREFPDLPVFELPDYGILYPSRNMYWNMAIQLWQMHKAIWLEKRAIAKICSAHQVDLVVSDARLGAAQRGVKSVIITHHLHFPLPLKLFEWFADNWMRFFYMQFDEIWVPDYGSEKNLSGDLSHLFKSRKHYFIGALSRFRKMPVTPRYDLCFMLSGPEPQRTLLEQKILQQIGELGPCRAILIRGTEHGDPLPAMPLLEVVPLATSEVLNEIMCASELIVCRSGYSTLLDLSVIGGRALLIPTPGQPEQEYLARELQRKQLFFTVSQDALDLQKHIPLAQQLPGYSQFEDEQTLSQILDARIGIIFQD
ncbi:MAG: hypothetical protein K1X68_11810 [Saprospiraceae bacterium]|nr:hypothetical protein [Saprospiraceae bacterium]HMW40306.1 glycosyltransferase [Saprospiraceae bacterium]HMX89609.1 glycosyltransferase [Saprospiraceae bacterium]HMZ41063.1 glycosyltransferase [Saprospiraceae bacterium]HNA65851.1 glycosyltransferase [Saprospiraceae bacterium]